MGPMTTARDIAHRYARKAHMCPYNKHSDRHQEHSAFCDALCTDITEYGREQTDAACADMGATP